MKTHVEDCTFHLWLQHYRGRYNLTIRRKTHFSKSFSGCHILQQPQGSIVVNIGFKEQTKDHHFNIYLGDLSKYLALFLLSDLEQILILANGFFCLSYNLLVYLVSQTLVFLISGIGLIPYIFHTYMLMSFSCVQLCDPMNCSMPGFPVFHYLPEFAQTHVHWVGDAIQPHSILTHCWNLANNWYNEYVVTHTPWFSLSITFSSRFIK